MRIVILKVARAFGFAKNPAGNMPMKKYPVVIAVCSLLCLLSLFPGVVQARGAHPSMCTTGVDNTKPLTISSSGQFLSGGCPFLPIGFNGSGMMNGSAAGNQTLQHIQQIKSDFPQINIVRIAYNADWWILNLTVPDANNDAGAAYDTWLEQNVTWWESVGVYVELDKATQFPSSDNPNPFLDYPCTKDNVPGANTQCTSQNQGQIDGLSQEQTAYIPPAEQAEAELAQHYAADNAILFDILNEPTVSEIPHDKDGSDTTYLSDMTTLANNIETKLGPVYVTDHPLVFWLRDYTPGLWDKNTYPDVIIDQHAYPSSCTPGVPTFTANSNMPLAQNYGQGWLLDEWGGIVCDPEPYNCDVVKVAETGDMGLAYFDASAMYDTHHGTYTLNSLGQEVQADYAQLGGGPVVCP